LFFFLSVVFFASAEGLVVGVYAFNGAVTGTAYD